MILHWDPMLGKYYGWWISGADSIDVLFDYHSTTGLASAASNVSLEASIDWGVWRPSIIPLPPLLKYQAMIYAATNFTWRGNIVITG